MNKLNQGLSLALLSFALNNCGKTTAAKCVPQSVMIAGCQVKAYKKNPYPYLEDIQLQQCKRKYPYDICYRNEKD
jgi:hypothetical protein